MLAQAQTEIVQAQITDTTLYTLESSAPLTRLATVNLFLVLFNAIPALPMDGGRVLRAPLAYRMGFARAGGEEQLSLRSRQSISSDAAIC